MSATTSSPVAIGAACFLCGGATRALGPSSASPIVRRCAACDTEVLSPLPTPEQLADRFAGHGAPPISEARCRELLPLADEAMELYLHAIGRAPRSARGLSLLEIGSGDGVSLISAVRRGLHGTGVDIDARKVEAARELAEKIGVHPTFLHGSVESLQGSGRTFELVKASQVMARVLDPRGFLAAAARLQPLGGHLILECPNNQALLWHLESALHRPFARERLHSSLGTGEYLWSFSRKGLTRLLDEAGYEILSCRDCSLGDVTARPEDRLRYPTLEAGLRRTLEERRAQPLLRALLRELDINASRFLSAGSGLSAVARKVRSAREPV